MYIVLYKFYCEYNQFEGNWSKQWDEFKTKKLANEFIISIKNDSDYKEIQLVKLCRS